VASLASALAWALLVEWVEEVVADSVEVPLEQSVDSIMLNRPVSSSV
jgi:hypothetical protein